MRLGQAAGATVLGICLALAVPLTAQTETVTLHNGAVFTGRLVSEGADYVELELSQGRVRLRRAWITVRERAQTTDRDPAPLKAPSNPFRLSPEEKASLEVMKIGARLVTPVAPWLPPPATAVPSPREVVQIFCGYLRGDEGLPPLDLLVDAEAVLQNALPSECRGLTTYSRGLAGRIFVAHLEGMLKRPYIRAAYLDAEPEMKELESGLPYVLIEVNFRRHGGLDEQVLVGVSQGRVVDLTLGPMPLPEFFRETRTILAGESTEARRKDLTGILELQAVRELGKEVVASIVGNGNEVRQAGFVPATENPAFILYLDREKWKQADRTAQAAGLDLVLRHQEPAACLLVRSEPVLSTPAEIARACLRNLNELGTALEVGRQRRAKVGHVTALRFLVNLTFDEEELTLGVMVFAAGGRAFQIVTCCRRQDADAFEPLLESAFAQLRLLGP